MLLDEKNLTYVKKNYTRLAVLNEQRQLLSRDRDLDKDVVHIHNEMLLTHLKKTQNTAICDNTDGFRDYAKCN